VSGINRSLVYTLSLLVILLIPARPGQGETRQCARCVESSASPINSVVAHAGPDLQQQFQSPDAYNRVSPAVPENHDALAAGGITALTVDGQPLYINQSGRVVNLIVSQSIYDDMAAGTVSSSQLAGISKILYLFYQDSFDFILLSNIQSNLTAGYYGKHFSTQNDIAGIGTSIYDNTAFWGSASAASGPGKLQGVIHFPYINGLVNGPGLHEITHRWANHVTQAFPTTVGGHWGFSSIGGQLGGWAEGTLVSLGGGQYQANKGGGSSWFGTFANGGNALAYGNLELYLMGMIPAGDLVGIQYAGNPAWVNSGLGIFSADAINSVSASSLISTLGARNPSFQNSQKSFNVLNVVVSTSPISAEQFVANDTQVASFSLKGDNSSYLFNFWEATGGVGSLNMDLGLSALKPGVDDRDDDGVPDVLDNCPAISNPGQADTNLNGIGDACEVLEQDWLLMLMPTILSANRAAQQ